MSEIRTWSTPSRTGVHDEDYGYDANGNRKYANGIPFESNAVNQTTGCGPLRYDYDARGNLISEAGLLGTTTYLYDGQNQLVAVVSASGPPVHFEYDAFGRRVLKRVGTSITRYVWAGDQLLTETTEQEGRREERDYLFLPGTHTPVSMRVDGATFQYHTDQHGTPRWLTDSRGEVAWSGVTYRFGHVDELVRRVRQPLRFPGQYFDEETGLHYNRARYYSPQLGRYLTRDPMDFIAGFNFYSYADNDPINGTDPLGLFSWTAATLAVGGIVAGAALIAVCLPAIAVTAAGMLAVAGVVAGAALVGGSVAMLGTDIVTDGCMPCMKAAFEKGVIEGAKIGFDVALLVLSAGAAGPGLALIGGGTAAAVVVSQGITAAAIAAAAAAGIVSMSSGGSGSGGDGNDGGGEDDEKAARRKADQENKARRKQERELDERAKKGEKDATIEQNKIKAQQQREVGRPANIKSAEGYEAENRCIEEEGSNVVEAGREVKYPNPRKPGGTISSDIDMETTDRVTQIKSGGDMPSETQADCTRLRAAETGKQPEVIYDPNRMPPDKLQQFGDANPDFKLTPKNLH
ncbi:MAG: RHS repeat-associated core domain-containing protein [Polyangiaceae bacterium]